MGVSMPRLPPESPRMSSVWVPTTLAFSGPARVFHLAMMLLTRGVLGSAVDEVVVAVVFSRIDVATAGVDDEGGLGDGTPVGRGAGHEPGVAIGVGQAADVALVRVAGDDLVDLGRHLRRDLRDRLRDAVALVDRLGLVAALVQQHDDGLDALLLELRGLRVGGLHLVLEVDAGHAGGADQGGGRLQGHPDEADLGAVDGLDPRAGQQRLAGVLAARRWRRATGSRRPRTAGRGSSSRRPGGSRRSACAGARSVPSSNSWLPTLLTSRPIALSDSTDGSSWNMPDRKVEPPMRSPAATVRLSASPTLARSSDSLVARYSAPPTGVCVGSWRRAQRRRRSPRGDRGSR